MANNLILAGKVVKPHGLQGELRVHLFAHSPFFLDNFSYIYLQKISLRPHPFKIISWRPHQRAILLLVEGISDRNEAEKWRGAELYLSESEFPAKQENEFFLYELIGWRVYLKDGQYLGEIKDIKTIGEAEVWEIKTLQNEEVLFPVTQEFVVDMLKQSQKAIIDPPEGLLDIYLKKS
ncbi:MAG: ribosome maturation factor RimM [Desulfonauticus sp.]|nr:ribosome maturation factor RimM [Desulfonauticus sp.]